MLTYILLIVEIGFLIFRRDAKKLENYDAGFLIFTSAALKASICIRVLGNLLSVTAVV